jgi:hypothetical protein
VSELIKRVKGLSIQKVQKIMVDFTNRSKETFLSFQERKRRLTLHGTQFIGVELMFKDSLD